LILSWGEFNNCANNWRMNDVERTKCYMGSRPTHARAHETLCRVIFTYRTLLSPRQKRFCRQNVSRYKSWSKSSVSFL
jgi:hypothetical protein